MLIECPECQLQISDKAINCPHCGYPLKNNRPYNHSQKRMRLPNGFGQITRIKGKNLRKPYRAMVTIGKDEYGKPICKLLKPESYFESYNDAYKALTEYNRNPYDLGNDITIEELHELWWKSNSVLKLSQSTMKVYEAAWKHCSSLKTMMLSEFRMKHLRLLLDSMENASMKRMVKIVFTRMFDYAVQYEFIEKNIIRDLTLDDNLAVKKNHITFTDDEMRTLWSNTHIAYVNWVLIQCYTGMRPQELCNIKLADVHLDQNIMYGGMKTKAGKNRAIPIHKNIISLVQKNIENSNKCGSEWLITTNKKHLTYNSYQYRFTSLIKLLKLNPEHRLHDARKQFVTMAKKYNVDEYAIKRIVGHHIEDITENIYTERELSWLVDEVNKIV